MTKEIATNLYHTYSKAKKYIIGFIYDDKVYMMEQNTISVDYLKEEKASTKNGGGYALRMRMTKTACKALVNNAIEIASVNDIQGNKGVWFEKFIHEMNNQTYKKDNIPFYVKGDINLNGVEYQIKFNNATICSYSTLERLAG